MVGKAGIRSSMCCVPAARVANNLQSRIPGTTPNEVKITIAEQRKLPGESRGYKSGEAQAAR
ncbi:MAG: hypothetical protein RI963_3699 [Planctomycetota bacterium]|jgi:hypothetical protein